MKRTYITAIPLYFDLRKEGPKSVNAVNFTLTQTKKEAVWFPISAIIADTASPEDEVKVLAVRQYHNPEEVNPNLAALRQELDELGLPNAEIIDIAMPETQSKDTQLDIFARLLDHLTDDTAYYADSTFGTKTFPVLLTSLMSYLDKLRENTTVGGIYYRELNHDKKTSRLFDVTAIFHVNNIVEMVARGTGDKARKRAAIKLLLTEDED